MALMKTLILALCIGHSAVLELPPRRRARLFSYMWCWVLLGHFHHCAAGFRRGAPGFTVTATTCRIRSHLCWCLQWSAANLRARHEHRREPSSEAKEERVLLLVYLLVDGTCGDPSIIALLGSDGAHT